ncbi:hypothetical protein Kfla_2418 [Kribbella flavida DSM 17836]|uniref:GerMN domain-containing protein n=1 Tax=Kribbella flavida (strain DSM 17836 / JCM 10339 / NBRC 14399) TaxID=479435 RepID=D2PV26_KRIFD|nr:Gmad2 immunoglobulin-like domain-containing protein [Kribbella flavida]ADB31492.1 hypothetical protein Kfla_2418 [Kribbella flavida DSM 17836]
MPSARRSVAGRGWSPAGAAVVGTAAAVGAFTLLDGSSERPGESEVAGPPATTVTAPQSAPTPAPSASPVPSPSSVPTEPPSAQPSTSGKLEPPSSRAVPVYWLGKTAGVDAGAGVRLYRTFTQIKGRPAYEAVQLMTAGKVADPDYSSPWLGAVVGSVQQSERLITVDFKQLPRETLKPDLARMAVQQLVYTVQAATGTTTPVEVTFAGRPVAQLFGLAVEQPLGRAPAADVQAFVWVTAPENDAVVGMPFKVSGIAAANEAQLNWRVISDTTRKVVAEGNTMTTEAFKFTPYSFTVSKLPAGRYTVEVFELSAADGRQTSTETKTVIVK